MDYPGRPTGEIPVDAIRLLWPRDRSDLGHIPDGTWIQWDSEHGPNSITGGILNWIFYPDYGLGHIEYTQYDTLSIRDRFDAWFFLEDGVWYLGGVSEYAQRGCCDEGVSPNCESALCEFRREMERAQRRMARMNMCQE